METISISQLKAHLSAELKRVQRGTALVILDHNRPVAEVVPVDKEALFVREAETEYECHELTPLTDIDPGRLLDVDRTDRW